MRVNIDNTDTRDCDAGGGPIFYYQNQPFTGIIEAFYSNSNMETEFEVIDGSVNGFVKDYYENGQLKAMYYQRYNGFYGESIDYDMLGNLLLHISWNEKTQERTIITDNRT